MKSKDYHFYGTPEMIYRVADDYSFIGRQFSIQDNDTHLVVFAMSDNNQEHYYGSVQYIKMLKSKLDLIERKYRIMNDNYLVVYSHGRRK